MEVQTEHNVDDIVRFAIYKHAYSRFNWVRGYMNFHDIAQDWLKRYYTMENPPDRKTFKMWLGQRASDTYRHLTTLKNTKGTSFEGMQAAVPDSNSDTLSILKCMSCDAVQDRELDFNAILELVTDKRAKDILIKRFVYKKEQLTIAEEYGVSRQVISRIVRRTLAKLKKELLKIDPTYYMSR